MKRFILFTLALIISTSLRAEWKPAAGPLMTKWAADVKPDSVLPEYPRPQMARKKWKNLNGLWQYQLVKNADEAKSPPLGKELPDQILVPFPAESALSGVMKRTERIVYRRTFDIPEDWAGQRVLLHFGAVNWESTVHVNGKNLGTHKGGYDPFSYDITDALAREQKETRPNEIVVTAFNPASSGEQPRGKQVNNPQGIYYLPSTGIWQTVWLEPVPQTYIKEIVITPDIDKKEVRIRAELEGDTNGLHLNFAVIPGAGAGTFLNGQSSLELSMPAGNIPLWTPDSPVLRDLEVMLTKDDKTYDLVKSYFAMRKIEIGKDNGITKILLNGKFLFQVGPLDQGFWPDGLYTAPTDAALKSDIEVAKELGFNMIRKHVKVEPQRWYYWTDKLGVLVWQDMPSGESPRVANRQRQERSPEGKQQHELELKRMIENLRNHPSIVMWVVFNEGWGQYDTERLTEWTKEFDPTRLVNNASGWTDKKCGDVMDAHTYPGPSCPPQEEKRAVVLGEFGGIGLAVEGHQWVKSDRNWGYQGLQKTPEGLAQRYETLLRRTYALVRDAGLSAAVYTQTTDVETESNGLLTYDRVMKTDPKRIATANRGQLRPLAGAKTLVPTSQKDPQTWRYTTEKPAHNWFKIDFDDSKWKEGPGGFGVPSTPGSVVKTTWNSYDIWLRRTVEIDADQFDDALFLCHHDEDVEIYINGVLAGQAGDFTSAYDELAMTPEGKKALKKGKNLIAVKCHQTRGGQYIDVGIISLQSK